MSGQCSRTSPQSLHCSPSVDAQLKPSKLFLNFKSNGLQYRLKTIKCMNNLQAAHLTEMFSHHHYSLLCAGFVRRPGDSALTTVSHKENRKKKPTTSGKYPEFLQAYWFFLVSIFAESPTALHFLSPLSPKQGTLFSYPYMFHMFRLLQDALEQRRHLTVEQQ